MGEIVDIREFVHKGETEKMTKLEFEARRIYLEGYMASMHKLQSLEMELEALAYDYGPSARSMTGMPSTSRKGDGSDRIISNMQQRDRLIKQIDAKREEVEKRRQEIERVIETTVSGNQQAVLTYRYMNDLEVDKIADLMSYSYKQVLNIHKSAVQHIKPPRHKIIKIKAELLEFHPDWAEIQVKNA